jgi:hypothetical protein
VLNLGTCQGTVAHVVHIAEEHRKDGTAAHIELM